MSYEVDVLAVGEESKSGDAIALRFGNFVSDPSDQTIIVIDGGFKSSGEKLVKRIKEQYHSNYVDLVISTHPDQDHINGLHVVLDELKVGELWMHTPWNISDDVKKMAEDRGFDTFLTATTLKKSLEAAYDLEKLATQKGIPIVEPFQRTSKFKNIVHVLGPSLEYYFELIADFDKSGNLSLSSLFEKAKALIRELWHQDQLIEPEEDAVSPRNNSSVITLVQLEKVFLFVGDGGVPAITRAADYADSQEYSLLSKVYYHHIPHHGSKRNLGPNILNRIIGPIIQKGQKISKTAIISAAPDGGSKHPSKRVKNALIRRGVDVAETCGSDHCYRSSDVPTRPGWVSIDYVEYSESYEEED